MYEQITFGLKYVSRVGNAIGRPEFIDHDPILIDN